MEYIVAIVGRPNVGKSSLFNRLVEGRKAITSPIEGTTRDRYYDVVQWCGHDFTLVDTGGYIKGGEDDFIKQISYQVELAIEQAHVVVLMVDCQQGLVGADADVAKMVRRLGKPVFVVANKADNAELEACSSDFYSLGFPSIYPISATHGTGTGDLLDALIASFPAGKGDVTTDHVPKIAIVGRPNVGKSTLLNGLLNKERSIVTPIADTTRSPVHTYYNLYGKKLMLVDTAGLRKKSQIRGSISFYAIMRSIKAIQQADVCTLLIDAEQGITHQDQQIMDLVYSYKKGLVVLVNKWDLMAHDHASFKVYRRKLLEQLGNRQHVPVVFTSGLEKKGIYQTLEKALRVYENRKQRLPTAQLNKVMLRAISDFAPPVRKGKVIHIKYVTQLPTTTPTFAFFCNLPQYITISYKRYLENKLQENFHFEGVPITMLFKQK